MGKITGIQEIGRDKKAVCVQVDGEEFGCIHAKVWKKGNLKLDDELPRKLWDQLLETERRYAQDTALYFLQSRMLSRKELEEKLSNAGYQPDSVEAALSKLSGYGFVDDAALADTLVKGAMTQKGWGKRRIQRKLVERGVDKQESLRALEEVDEGDEEAVARNLLPSLTRRYASEADPKKRKQKIAQALMRRGFDWPVITRVLGAEEEGED